LRVYRWPIISYLRNLQAKHSASALHTNGTGQVPDITGFRGLIDRDTPTSAYTKTGSDGQEYTLVFSDEFNMDGRTFYDGDDPYWTAMDMYYYSTGDLEYYNPQSVTTAGGYLVINLTEVPDATQNHNLKYMSGMLQSWNQLCFTGGIVEGERHTLEVY
jgi:beta-glucanase (GH16 family)